MKRIPVVLAGSILVGALAAQNPPPQSGENTADINKATATSYWEESKARFPDQAKALDFFFATYSKHGQFLPEVERLLIGRLQNDKAALAQRFVLADVKIDSMATSTAVTARQVDGGALALKGNVEISLNGGENMLGDGAIHRWQGLVKDVTLSSREKGAKNYTFFGEDDDPVTFGCVSGVGYVYLHGKGRVLVDGKETRLGYTGAAGISPPVLPQQPSRGGAASGSVPVIERAIVREIRARGPGTRFVVTGLKAGHFNVAGGQYTLEQPEAGRFLFVRQYAEDSVVLELPGGPMKPELKLGEGFGQHLLTAVGAPVDCPFAEGAMWRPKGKVSCGGYTFIAEADSPNQLSFVFLKEFGLVYVQGRGTVVTESGERKSLGQ